MYNTNINKVPIFTIYTYEIQIEDKSKLLVHIYSETEQIRPLFKSGGNHGGTLIVNNLYKRQHKSHMMPRL